MSDERLDVTIGSKVSEPIGIYRRDFNQVDKAEREGLVLDGIRPADLTNACVSKGPSYIAGIIHKIIERGL